MEQNKSGQVISSLRKKKGLTQAELAARIGVTDKAVSKWENGRGMPDVDLLKPLCDELGITTDEFLAGTTNKVKGAERLKRKNRIDKGVLAAVIIVLCSLLIWGYQQKKHRDAFLKEEFIQYTYGQITHIQSWDGTDKAHLCIWVAADGMRMERFEVDINTIMSDELRERLEKGEINISVKILSIYTGKQYVEGHGESGLYSYPAHSIELWGSE